jgi:hypothetical protein
MRLSEMAQPSLGETKLVLVMGVTVPALNRCQDAPPSLVLNNVPSLSGQPIIQLR